MSSVPWATLRGALGNIPALAPPPDVIPDLEHPANHVRIAVVWGSLELLLMLIFYAVRVYSRVFIIRRFRWDDLTRTFGVVGVTAYFAAIVVGCKNGPIGKHQYEVYIGDVLNNKFIIISCLVTTLGALPLLAIKLIFFILYLHLFRPMRWLVWWIYIGAIITTMFYYGAVIAQIILCSPAPGETWTEHLFSEAGEKAAKLAIPIGAVGLAADTYILVLPIVGVLQLQLSSRKKLGTCLIFLTGLLTCVTASISLYYRVLVSQTNDLTWYLFDVQFLNATEIFVGIICACMPSVSKTIQHHQTHIQLLGCKFRGRSIHLRSIINGGVENSNQERDSSRRRLSPSYNLGPIRPVKCALRQAKKGGVVVLEEELEDI